MSNKTSGQITFSKSVEEYPLSLQEAKRWLHIGDDENDQDDEVLNLIYACTEEAEDFIGKDISKKLCTYTFYNFSSDTIQIFEGNFNSTVEIITDASTLVTVDTELPYYNYFELLLTSTVDSDPLTVKFYTGYSAQEVPIRIKQAISMRIKDYMDIHRGSESDNRVIDTKTFERLLSGLRNTRF